MEYLTFEEYQKRGGRADGEEFKKLLPFATSLLDIQTNNFYIYNKIEDDKIKHRVDRFKQSIVAQIDFFKATGTTNSYEINRAPQSFSAGRTSINFGSGSATTKSGGQGMLAEEAVLLLEGTGLLYRGIS